MESNIESVYWLWTMAVMMSYIELQSARLKEAGIGSCRGKWRFQMTQSHSDITTLSDWNTKRRNSRLVDFSWRTTLTLQVYSCGRNFIFIMQHLLMQCLTLSSLLSAVILAYFFINTLDIWLHHRWRNFSETDWNYRFNYFLPVGEGDKRWFLADLIASTFADTSYK